MTQDAWGFLGRPPQHVLDDGGSKMERFRYYQGEVKKAEKLKDRQKRAIKLAEIKAKYLREFTEQ